MNQVRQDDSQVVLITLHGLRTYGKWQHSLKRVLDQHNANIIHYTMNYGFIKFFRAYIPRTRKKILEHALEDLEKIIQNNQDKDIHVVAHSFGTHVILKYLAQKKLKKKIKTLILAASIEHLDYLEKNDLGANVEKLFNDCATRDHMLYLNNFLSINFGDSGRIGFNLDRLQNIRAHNRYFKGGHKVFFDDEFYKKNWLPHLLDSSFI